MHSVANVKHVSEESKSNPSSRLKTVVIAYVITVGCVMALCLFLLRSTSGTAHATNWEKTPDLTSMLRRRLLMKTHSAIDSTPFIRVNLGEEISQDRAETWCKEEFDTGLAPILCRKTLEIGRRLCNGDCWVADGTITTRSDNREKRSQTNEKKNLKTMSSFLCKNPRATVDPCNTGVTVRRLHGGFSYSGGGACRSCGPDDGDGAELYEQRHVPGIFPIFAMNVSTTIGKGPMVASLIYSLAKMLNVSSKSVSGHASVFLYNITANDGDTPASMYEVAIADSNTYSLSEELLLLTKVNDFLFKTLLQENVTTAIRQVFSTGDVTVHNFTGVPTTRASARWKQMQRGNESSSARPSAPSSLFVGLVVAGAVLGACLIGCGAWHLHTKKGKNPKAMDEIQEVSDCD